MTVPAWNAPGVDDVASRLTAALLRERGIYAPQQAVAMFWQVRRLLLAGEPVAPVAVGDGRGDKTESDS